jgi:hypothetical protein
MNSYSFKEVHIKHVISEDTVRNLLRLALEQGSNYWMYLLKYEYPYCTIHADFVEGGKYAIVDKSGGCLGVKGAVWAPMYLLPFHRGGGIIIEEKSEDVRHTIVREKLLHGLDMMAQKYPRHFQNVIDGTATHETGDIFLQCSLFDDIVFGHPSTV